MHPMLSMAMANEVERDRRSERQKLQLWSVAMAGRSRRFRASRAARDFARRLIVGLSVRPRLS
jgi:hypothetical protein